MYSTNHHYFPLIGSIALITIFHYREWIGGGTRRLRSVEEGQEREEIKMNRREDLTCGPAVVCHPCQLKSSSYQNSLDGQMWMVLLVAWRKSSVFLSSMAKTKHW
jgi:hypothetical protein